MRSPPLTLDLSPQRLAPRDLPQADEVRDAHRLLCGADLHDSLVDERHRRALVELVAASQTPVGERGLLATADAGEVELRPIQPITATTAASTDESHQSIVTGNAGGRQ